MNQGYDRGWCRYSFEEVAMSTVRAHGSSVAIRAASAIQRGTGDLQMSLIELPVKSDDEDAIGLHIHRDFRTDRDSEEIYIVIDGECEMTFTNGDIVRLRSGDCVTTYPGTGHSVRVVGTHPVRVVVIVPIAFRTTGQAPASDPLPAWFSPRVEVVAYEPTALTPLDARCTECDADWSAGLAEQLGELPSWAASHACSKR